MIKEYNYYITTNRFSQIAEELETTVRSYAESIGKVYRPHSCFGDLRLGCACLERTGRAQPASDDTGA